MFPSSQKGPLRISNTSFRSLVIYSVSFEPKRKKGITLSNILRRNFNLYHTNKQVSNILFFAVFAVISRFLRIAIALRIERSFAAIRSLCLWKLFWYTVASKSRQAGFSCLSKPISKNKMHSYSLHFYRWGISLKKEIFLSCFIGWKIKCFPLSKPSIHSAWEPRPRVEQLSGTQFSTTAPGAYNGDILCFQYFDQDETGS